MIELTGVHIVFFLTFVYFNDMNKLKLCKVAACGTISRKTNMRGNSSVVERSFRIRKARGSIPLYSKSDYFFPNYCKFQFKNFSRGSVRINIF